MRSIKRLQLDYVKKQKRGLHIILTSVVIWIGIAVVDLSSITIRLVSKYPVILAWFMINHTDRTNVPKIFD